MNIVGYYQIHPADNSVAVVLKDYWDEYQGLDGDGIPSKLLPDGFYELQESIYEHEFDSNQAARDALEAAGFVEKDMFDI